MRVTGAKRPARTRARPTVFAVDDNAGMRRSLRALMESSGFAAETYASSEEFLAAYDPGRAGCLLLDVRLRHGSGLDLQDELRRRQATLPIIVFTGHGDVPTSVRAMKAGAFDFLQKPVPPSVLLERVGAALALDRRTRAATTARDTAMERRSHLTPRDAEVMMRVVAGQTAKAIAAELGISVRSVEAHRRVVLAKMHVTSAAELVRAVLPTYQAETPAS